MCERSPWAQYSQDTGRDVHPEHGADRGLVWWSPATTAAAATRAPPTAASRVAEELADLRQRTAVFLVFLAYLVAATAVTYERCLLYTNARLDMLRDMDYEYLERRLERVTARMERRLEWANTRIPQLEEDRQVQRALIYTLMRRLHDRGNPTTEEELHWANRAVEEE